MNYLNNNKRIVKLCNGEYGKSHAGTLFYPYQYIPEIIETAFACICFDVMVGYSPMNSTFSNLTVFFWPVCHLDIAIMKNETGLRYDLMAHEIIRDFADQDVLGIGKTQIAYNHIYTVAPELRGREIQLGIFDVSPEAYNRHAKPAIW